MLRALVSIHQHANVNNGNVGVIILLLALELKDIVVHTAVTAVHGPLTAGTGTSIINGAEPCCLVQEVARPFKDQIIFALQRTVAIHHSRELFFRLLLAYTKMLCKPLYILLVNVHPIVNRTTVANAFCAVIFRFSQRSFSVMGCRCSMSTAWLFAAGCFQHRSGYLSLQGSSNLRAFRQARQPFSTATALRLLRELERRTAQA